MGSDKSAASMTPMDVGLPCRRFGMFQLRAVDLPLLLHHPGYGALVCGGLCHRILDHAVAI